MVGVPINGMPAMCAAACDTARRRPRFSRAALSPMFRLTERDIEIVRHVASHRLLRSTHISQLLDAPHKKILERLTALYHAGYLDRPRAQLEYHVQGGGSAPLVYALAPGGVRLLAANSTHADLGRCCTGGGTGRDFILHTLAVADVLVALTLACRAHGSLGLQAPENMLPQLPEPTRNARNPWAWRARVQHGGASEEIGILPDHVFALLFPDGRRRAFFLECDRGTMPVERPTLHRSSMLRKFLAYEATYRQAIHTERFGWKNFRVLIITTSAGRADVMRDLLERTPSLRGSPLFLFAEQTAAMSPDVLMYRWRDSSGQMQRLA